MHRDIGRITVDGSWVNMATTNTVRPIKQRSWTCRELVNVSSAVVTTAMTSMSDELDRMPSSYSASACRFA